ncbi:LpqB family beta-propeller domain-containing protein [Dactylosporangium sp. NPDC051541]|uniref:LpqB family beta-propeller domain-containing protein n=1 Tax=Dactylosporangium sp. NPDC051541 TaxID=3363977 RepID=UPI0037B3F4F6
MTPRRRLSLPRSRRRTGAALVAAGAVLAAVAGLSGCGLPSRTEPKYAGPAPSPAAAQAGVKSPPDLGSEKTTKDLVTSFLQSSVGANLGGAGAEPDANKEALDRLRKAMTDTTAATWKPPKPGMTIVRDPIDIEGAGDGRGGEQVVLPLHPVAVLNENGEVVPPASYDDITETYQTVFVGGQLRLSMVPDRLYISESGLKNWYLKQSVYFWESDSDNPRLVPDLRYMPSTLSKAKQVNEIIKWLQNGPGQLLQNVAEKLPDGLTTKENPVFSDSDVRVNLRGTATLRTDAERTRLARQIRWSLPDHKPVKLMIEGQPDNASSDGYDDFNAAIEASEVDQRRFCIVNGSVRTDALGIGVTENPLFAPGGDNTGVVSAAINRQGNKAALVRLVNVGGGKNEQRLYVLSPAALTSPPKYVYVNVAGARLSRPAWITYPFRRLLVSDGSHLFISTDESAQTFETVGLGTGLSTLPITAFSVAPEGRRIAFIADGNLMVAPLLLDNNKISIGQPVQIATTLGDTRAVGWLGETTLAVGGKPSPRSAHPLTPTYSLVAVTIDGAEEDVLPQQLREDTQLEVTQLVAQVNRPDFPQKYSVMFESNGVALRLYSSFSDPLKLEDPTPPSGNQAPRTPTAPFFAD